ncbi:14770_t:CDS:1, partial [Gigaspora rosea]
MPKVSKIRDKVYKAAQTSADARKAVQRSKQINDISQTLTQIDDNKLQSIFSK